MVNRTILYTERATRIIVRRTIIHGRLELTSPTLISNGDSDLPTDMALLRDAAEGKALVPGSSIAGALRAYLAATDHDAANTLFGAPMSSEDSDGDQSAILISDAISSAVPQVDVRDGVKIDGTTRTASDSAKYDLELLPQGTTFTLRFELIEEVLFHEKQALWDEEPARNQRLRQSLAQALHGLEHGAIAMGMRKQRGLGECKITSWQVWQFDMHQPSAMLAWLRFDGNQPNQTGNNIAHLLKCAAPTANTSDCTITATFGLNQSLLIRSASEQAYTPDDVFLATTHVNGTTQPIIPGTSWAGVIRHRAEKIWRTINPIHPAHESVTFVKELFGFVDERTHTAQRSRIRIADSQIKNGNTDYLQTRIAIDRFTGGPYPGALLVEQPVWGTRDTRLTLNIRITQPREAEIGLLLLVLKDLWLGDLPVGGEQSIGRGVLRGQQIELTVQGTKHTIKQNADGSLHISDPKALQAFVNHLNERGASA